MDWSRRRDLACEVYERGSQGQEDQFRDDKCRGDVPSLGDSSGAEATNAALDLERSNSNSSLGKEVL
jgi:hypothetical protein